MSRWTRPEYREPGLEAWNHQVRQSDAGRKSDRTQHPPRPLEPGTDHDRQCPCQPAQQDDQTAGQCGTPHGCLPRRMQRNGSHLGAASARNDETKRPMWGVVQALAPTSSLSHTSENKPRRHHAAGCPYDEHDAEEHTDQPQPSVPLGARWGSWRDADLECTWVHKRGMHPSTEQYRRSKPRIEGWPGGPRQSSVGVIRDPEWVRLGEGTASRRAGAW